MTTPTFDAQNLISYDLDNRGKKHKFTLPGDDVSKDIVTKIITGKTYPSQPFLADIIDCVFDIGANIGAACVYFRFAFPNAPIHAFEPNALSLPLLRQNLEPWENIEIHPFGLFDKNMEAPIHISGESGECSSIKLEYGNIKGTMDSIELRKTTAELDRLAPHAKNICLKIDTEGCEAEILESLTGHFEKIAIVFLEYHSETQRRRIEQCMTAQDFTLFASSATMPHRGDLFFIATRLIKNDDVWNFLAID